MRATGAGRNTEHGLKFREIFATFREISFVSWVHKIFSFLSKKFVVFELPD
jgi:hypothetical protein